jgi:hypothetical protein
MEVLSTDQIDEVSGGLSASGWLGWVFAGIEQISTAIHGAIDGARDGYNGKPYDPDAAAS